MKTIISTDFQLAKKYILNGEVVAIPTETVYGLAANAYNKKAILKVFQAKGRPADNPLILHVSDVQMAKKLVKYVPKAAKVLIDTFWPGPLSIVFEKSSLVPYEATGGQETVAIRMPSNPICLEIIRLCGVPLAAPSANSSGKPSPTSCQHVFDDLNGKIPLIIDGGICDIGLESTVVSLIDSQAVLLRPGGITVEMMEEAGVSVKLSDGVLNELQPDKSVLSPGMKYKHYSPDARITIVQSSIEDYVKFVNKSSAVALVPYGYERGITRPYVNYSAQQLFSALRRLDGAGTVYAFCPKKTQLWLAVYNRLIRASGFRIIELK